MSKIKIVLAVLFEKAKQYRSSNTFLILICLIILAAAPRVITYYSNPPTKEIEVRLYLESSFDPEGKPSPLIISFYDSVAKLDLAGKPLPSGVTITPQIKGTWEWYGGWILRFTPQEDWVPGQKYAIKADESIFLPHIKLKNYKYSFTPPAFVLSVKEKQFYQDPVDFSVKRAMVTLVFSHPVNPAELEKRISLRLPDKSLPYVVVYNKYKTEACITSSPLELDAQEKQINVTVKSGVVSALGGNKISEDASAQVQVPSLYTMFKVQNLKLAIARNKNYEPELVLVSELTARALEQEIQNNISAYELPQDYPSHPGAPERKNFRWEGTRITPDLLKYAKKLELQPVPAEMQYSLLHSFKLAASQGRAVYIKINKNTKAAGGYLLAHDFETILRVPNFPKELTIMQDGAILSLHGDKKLPIVSRGVADAEFELWRVTPNQINHIISQSYGKFRDPQFNYNFGPENIAERFSLPRHISSAGPEKTAYTYLDLSEYSDAQARRGLFFLRLSEWDPIKKTALRQHDSRMVMITDMGLLAKKSKNGGQKVFVQSISSGWPVEGAQVQILGKNGLPVAAAETNALGEAHFGPTDSFVREKTPVAYVAKKDGDISFMPYQWDDRELNFSRFDIGGIYEDGTENPLMCYVFSDRGIYRPGDEIHVGIILKSADWQTDVSNMPFEAVITDPRGMEVLKKKQRFPPAGLGELGYPLDEAAPTGAYTISLYIVKDGKRAGLLGSASVRVEEFLPDRMKISARMSKEQPTGWVSPEGLKGLAQVHNLFGTPAAGRRVTASVIYLPAPPAFKNYKDYVFRDHKQAEKGFREDLQETVTGPDGMASFALDLKKFEKSTFLIRFQANAFEPEGGRSVGAETSALVSTLEYLVGYKTDGKLDFVNKNSRRLASIIAINGKLQQTAASGLTARLIEERYVSSLIKDNFGNYKYASVLKEIPVKNDKITIPAEGFVYQLDTANAGDFKIVIEDKAGVKLCEIPYSVAGHGNLARSLEKNAELQIRLDRNDYLPGDEIAVSIKAPYAGAGVITIERDKVYAAKWFKTGQTATVETIKLPAEVEGNAYVNVAFVRAPESREIFMSPLSYGVVPFTVSRSRRTCDVELKTPSIIKPGGKLVVRYKTDRPAKIAVFAVDEGILQVAAYKMPDPLAHFYRKKALGVRTFQILDLILPEFKLLSLVSSSGGDTDWSAIGKNLNPFKRKRDKPVAYWSGILNADSKEREVTFGIPDYFNGSVRVMAVAVAQNAVGAAREDVTVRGPLIISANAPLAVAPQDEFELTAGITNNLDSGEKTEINVKAEVSEGIKLLDGAARSLKVEHLREGTVKFRLRAGDKLGPARVTLTASAGAASVKSVSELSVRPSAPYRTFLQTGTFKNGKAKISLERKMYADYKVMQAGASLVPLGIAWGLVDYLNSFQYYCTEQVLSKAFPALVLAKRPEFAYSQQKLDAALEEAAKTLRARQNPDGSIARWAAGGEVSDLQNVYAMHFLTEAADAGYVADSDILKRGLDYLKVILRRQPADMDQARENAYALYVLTRNAFVLPGDIENLKKQLERASELKGWEKDITGAYMAATYALIEQRSLADSLIAKSELGDRQSSSRDGLYGQLSRDSQLVYLLALHFPEKLKKMPGNALLPMVSEISAGNYNTFSSANAVLAFDAYARLVENLKTSVRLDAVSPGKKQAPLALPANLCPKVDLPPQTAQVIFSDSSKYNVFYQVIESGYDLPPFKPLNEGIELFREYTKDGKPVAEASLGDEIEAHIKLRSTGAAYVPDVVIVDLLPGGFEPVDEKRKTLPAASQPADEEGDEPVSTGRAESLGRTEMREDRVIIYTSASNSISEYSYKLKAASRGSFTVPPPFCQSLYDHKIQALGQAGRITIK